MLLNLSKLTGDDNDKRSYINTRMIVWVGAVTGDPDKTLIYMADHSKAVVEKPVDVVVTMLKERDASLML